jgi:hypothetical protein
MPWHLFSFEEEEKSKNNRGLDSMPWHLDSWSWATKATGQNHTALGALHFPRLMEALARFGKRPPKASLRLNTDDDAAADEAAAAVEFEDLLRDGAASSPPCHPQRTPPGMQLSSA